MAEVVLKRIVNVSIETAWDIWDDYGNIANFHPLLSGSHVLEESGGESTGLGCKRVCEFKDGKNYLKEEIIAYEPYQKIVINVYESTMPLKEAKAIITFNALHPYSTEVTFTMQFIPKMGLLGKMITPLMKMQFSKMLGQMMDAFADYAHGVDKKAA
ncbi:MAG: hypothetical protein COB34_03555 [Methylophilaceae bacterium]|nr:MAG: hypothetical protein COB34_03555 [Methylophilaceae bacterium]